MKLCSQDLDGHGCHTCFRWCSSSDKGVDSIHGGSIGAVGKTSLGGPVSQLAAAYNELVGYNSYNRCDC